MAWIDNADFLPSIRGTRLEQLIDGETSIQDNAVDSAVAIVRDYLKDRYDVDAVFSTTGAQRPLNAVRWVMVIALYYLYERLPDNMMPKRIEANYVETIEFLGKVAAGDRSVDLPRLPDGDGSGFLTKFKWGSDERRSL